jgi:type IV secretion system protein VirB3
MSTPPGFEVPLHRALSEPMLVGGLPRTVAFVLWIVVAMLALGLRQLWTLPLGVALHALAAAVTRGDPHVLTVALRSLRFPDRLDP